MSIFRSIVTADTYGGNEVIFATPVERFTITVMSASILAQFYLVPLNEHNLREVAWDSAEHEMIPGVWGWSSADFNGQQIMGIRIRSSIAGTPASVNLSA